MSGLYESFLDFVFAEPVFDFDDEHHSEIVSLINKLKGVQFSPEAMTCFALHLKKHYLLLKQNEKSVPEKKIKELEDELNRKKSDIIKNDMIFTVVKRGLDEKTEQLEEIICLSERLKEHIVEVYQELASVRADAHMFKEESTRLETELLKERIRVDELYSDIDEKDDEISEIKCSHRYQATQLESIRERLTESMINLVNVDKNARIQINLLKEECDKLRATQPDDIVIQAVQNATELNNLKRRYRELESKYLRMMT